MCEGIFVNTLHVSAVSWCSDSCVCVCVLWDCLWASDEVPVADVQLIEKGGP